LFADKHLHIDKNDEIVELLAMAMKSAKAGSIRIDIKGRPSVKIDVDKDKILVDLLEPVLFKNPQDETGLFDKLKTSKEFADMLSANDLTISLLRKGKEAITLGKDAKPTLSRFITRSSHIQIDNIKETAHLKGEFKAK